MAAVQTLLAGRRVRLWFAAATLLPLAGLGWLGWTILERDAASAQSRLEDRREQALDLAVAALARTVDEAEAHLASAAASPGGDNWRGEATPDAVAIVVFNRRGVMDRRGAPLPYYPCQSVEPAFPADPFPSATAAEFVRRDLAAVLSELAPHTRAPDPALRAEAWLRTARVARRTGDHDRALAAYRALELLGNTRAGDWPAALTARLGRAALFEGAGRTAELRAEARALRADLDRGHSVLTAVQFETALAQALEWSGQPHDPGDPASPRVLADAVGSVWRTWQAGSVRDDRTRHRTSVRSGEGAALALWQASDERLIVLAAGAQFLETAWLRAVQERADAFGVRLALTHDGRRLVGDIDPARGEQSDRSFADPSLTWIVHAASVPALTPSWSGPAVLGLLAVGLTAIMLLVSAFVVSRAIERQIAVAAMQADFVAAVSHEFRTPLTTIRQLSEMLARGRVSSDSRRQEFYETVLRDSTRLQRLVETVLDFGRMEARATSHRFEVLDPRPLVERVVHEFQRETTTAGVVIDFDVRDPLPAIHADRESLERAIWNLLDNAVKYSPDDQRIQVSVDAADSHVRIRVRDRGIGIPPEEQDAVFQKFVRGQAARDASIRGTGLGLAMVMQIVEAHGGRVTLESAVGAGSTFCLHLPLPEGT